MNIIDRLTDGLPLMNNQCLAAGLVMQRKRAGKHINRIGKWVRVPWQNGMGRNRQPDRCELRLACRVVCVRFAIPRMIGLQKDFSFATRNTLRSALREHGWQRCSKNESSCECDAVFRNHIGPLRRCFAFRFRYSSIYKDKIQTCFMTLGCGSWLRKK